MDTHQNQPAEGIILHPVRDCEYVQLIEVLRRLRSGRQMARVALDEILADGDCREELFASRGAVPKPFTLRLAE